MTRRERLEHKIEKRTEWAEKAAARSSAAFKRAGTIADSIPFGQPILVGHHSERHARADQKRMSNAMDKSCEQQELAALHSSKAAGLENMLDHTIFSDDPDALEAIEARIAANEAKRESMKTVNKLYRKKDADGLKALGLDLEQLQNSLKNSLSWMQQPHPAYELQNLGGRITADRKRLGIIKAQQKRKADATATENGVMVKYYGGIYASVTFAEKPAHAILTALREAGFRWGGGQWTGKTEVLPAEVKALAEAEQPTA